MNDWLQKNLWALLIGLMTLVSSYAVYGARITTLEQKVASQQTEIDAQNTANVQIQIALAQLQTSVEYIKLQLNKIVP